MKKFLLPILCLASFFFQKNVSAQAFFFNIHEPSAIRTVFDTTDFGRTTGWGAAVTDPLIGEMVLATDLDGETFMCDTLGFQPGAFDGKFVMIDRQICEFGQKALNAQKLGAIAVVIVNFDNNILSMGTGASGGDVTIPVIMVKKLVGDLLRTELIANSTVIVSFSPTAIATASIRGHVRADENADCSPDQGEPGLAKWKITAQNTATGHSHTAISGLDGSYKIAVDTGIWQVTTMPSSPIWANCSAAQTFNLPQFDSLVVDFSGNPLTNCPQMVVEIATPLLRRCFDNNVFWVNWCNQGTATALNATITVHFDPLITPVSASLPYQDLGGGDYLFSLGNVGISTCGSFNITTEVSCDAVLGQVICTQAQALPDTICVPPTSLWTGADVRASGYCSGDSVHFQLKNVGYGDMAQPVKVRFLKNGGIESNDFYQLNAGQAAHFSKKANNNLWRIEAEQTPDHPFANSPSKTVASCDAPEAAWPVFNQFAQADYGPGFDETCDEVIGSFDPNDKAAIPEGYGNQHFIERGQELEYKIRFQNTGTDTAFTVVVRDTLSAFVDPLSVRAGASSHAFELDYLSVNVLRFTFKDILLVDSFTNEPASHGFFTYKIAQKPSLPLGSVIKNSAAIFFDFNAPVITNETFNTIGENFLSVSTGHVFIEKTSVEVLPNPMGDRAEIRVKGLENELLNLCLFTADGQFLLEKTGIGNSIFLDRFGLPKGLLIFFIEKKDGQRVAVGKLAVE